MVWRNLVSRCLSPVPAGALLFVGFFLLCSSAAYSSMQMQQLLTNRVRYLFSDQQRALQANFTNPTNMEINYAVSLEGEEQNSEGVWVKCPPDSAKEKQLRKMLRFSPRRAKIPAMERQVVRMMLRKPAGLPAGEYRARLLVTPQVEKMNRGRAADAEKEDQVGLGATVYVSASYPVVVLHDLPAAKVEPVSCKIEPVDGSVEKFRANISWKKTEGYTSFGNVKVYYHPSSGKKKLVGVRKEMVIYSPEKSLQGPVVLKNITKDELQSGSLEVVYSPGTYDARDSKKSATSREFPL